MVHTTCGISILQVSQPQSQMLDNVNLMERIFYSWTPLGHTKAVWICLRSVCLSTQYRCFCLIHGSTRNCGGCCLPRPRQEVEHRTPWYLDPQICLGLLWPSSEIQPGIGVGQAARVDSWGQCQIKVSSNSSPLPSWRIIYFFERRKKNSPDIVHIHPYLFHIYYSD